GELGLAWLDVSTGDFMVEALESERLAAALGRVEPSELLLPDRLLGRPEAAAALAEWKHRLVPLPGARFDSENARRRLEALFKVGTMAAFGDFGRAELAAAGALVDYLDLTQKGRLPHLSPPRRLGAGGKNRIMEIDAATRRNLELVRALDGGRRGSLLACIDRTVTGAGARLLAARLAAPLVDPEALDERLDAVAYLVQEGALRAELRAGLKAAPDMERALSRLSLGRGGPRDLAAVRDGLEAARRLHLALVDQRFSPCPSALRAATERLVGQEELLGELQQALAGELPVAARDGGFIAVGYDEALDELKTLRDESRKLIAALQAKYAEETGIASLKVKHNNVLGYFIEVSASNVARMHSGPESPFIHRQTLASATRYVTVELSDLEKRIVSAADKALALELEIFGRLCSQVLSKAEAVAAAARALAEIDVAAALAELAVTEEWTRPQVEDSTRFEIEGGRHPVVEAALEAEQGGPFVANDCNLSGDQRLWLIT